MNAWAILAAAAALCVFAVIFLAGLLLLSLFVRNAAIALVALSDLGEHTLEKKRRREVVDAAEEAVEDIRRRADYHGDSGIDEDLMAGVMAERAMNGKSFRVEDNERSHYDEQPEPEIDGDSFFVPAEEQI